MTINKNNIVITIIKKNDANDRIMVVVSNKTVFALIIVYSYTFISAVSVLTLY